MEGYELKEVPSWTDDEPPTKVRIFADAYIPWECIKIPHTPSFALPFFLGILGHGFDVHGDGRGPANSSSEVGDKYRLMSMVEVDILEKKPDTFSYIGNNQYSSGDHNIKIETLFKGWNTPAFGLKRKGGFTLTGEVNRLRPNAVKVELNMSGKVSRIVAGPQPPINYRYIVILEQDSALGEIKWTVNAEHDGFPSHEFFIESAGKMLFSRNYSPEWFSDISSKDAYPNLLQSLRGFAALGGWYKKQSWSESSS